MPRRSGETAEAGGKDPSYTYTPDGKLATRTWARGGVTTYAYTNGSSLVAIDYSDETPDVTLTYDRLGRQKVAQTFLSAHHYAYDPATLALVSETIISGGETNVLSRTQDTLGRAAGLSLGPDFAVGYGYDEYGRFQSATSASSASSAVAFSYSYLPNSDILSGMTASSGFQWTRTYEPQRDLLTVVVNTWGTNRISRFDYANDSLA